MTDDDIAGLARFSNGLASIDLDAARADDIGRRAGDELGSASRRGAEIIAAGTFAATYLAWVVVHVVGVFS